MRRILRVAPSAAGPPSWEEGSVVVAVLCWLVVFLVFLALKCFEFFGFPVKFVEAGWLLEIIFMANGFGSFLLKVL